MVTYFLNWMGPVSQKWYLDNKIPYQEIPHYSSILGRDVTYTQFEKDYSCGRIDIHDGSPHGNEYFIGVMESASWYKLADFIKNLETEKVLTKKEILDKFESRYGKIVWFKSECSLETL